MATIYADGLTGRRFISVYSNYVLEVYVESDENKLGGKIAQSVINLAQTAITSESFEALPADDNVVTSTGTKAQPKAITPQWVYYGQAPASYFTTEWPDGRPHVLAIWPWQFYAGGQTFMGSSCGAWSPVDGCISNWTWWRTQPYQGPNSALGISSSWLIATCGFFGVCGWTANPSNYRANVYFN